MSLSVSQTEKARARRPQPMELREFAAQAVVGSLFLATSAALAATGLEGGIDAVDFALLVLAQAALGRLDFEIGPGYTVPTQLVFVPMLFVLPPAVVPLAVATALVLDRLPDLLAGRAHPQRLLGAIGDAWFSAGPALVFVAAGLDEPSLGDWPLYALALAAQFAGDLASSLLREWLGRGVAPLEQLRVMAQVWTVDLLLAPIGLLAAFAAERQPRAYLLVLPLGVLLAVFARERQGRIDREIELGAAYRGTAFLLGDVLTEDDEYTGVHSQGVVVLALAIADDLRMGEDERRLVEFGALLHDIGKLETPKEIIAKEGPLDDDEWQVMRDHVLAGQRMLDRVGGTLHDVGVIVRCSHEHFDGGGYPDGLAGEDIPLAARVVSVADAYSAMTTSRCYRGALPHAEAVAELRTNSGTQFDPAVVAAAARVLARLPMPAPSR